MWRSKWRGVWGELKINTFSSLSLSAVWARAFAFISIHFVCMFFARCSSFRASVDSFHSFCIAFRVIYYIFKYAERQREREREFSSQLFPNVSSVDWKLLVDIMSLYLYLSPSHTHSFEMSFLRLGLCNIQFVHFVINVIKLKLIRKLFSRFLISDTLSLEQCRLALASVCM